jgi:hypothetical protein
MTPETILPDGFSNYPAIPPFNGINSLPKTHRGTVPYFGTFSAIKRNTQLDA